MNKYLMNACLLVAVAMVAALAGRMSAETEPNQEQECVDAIKAKFDSIEIPDVIQSYYEAVNDDRESSIEFPETECAKVLEGFFAAVKKLNNDETRDDHETRDDDDPNKLIECQNVNGIRISELLDTDQRMIAIKQAAHVCGVRELAQQGEDIETVVDEESSPEA